MPSGMYDSLTCQQASRERTQLAAKLAGLEKQQNGAATGDAIGVFLVLIPVSTLTSGDKEGEVATAKGQMLALDARLATCR